MRPLNPELIEAEYKRTVLRVAPTHLELAHRTLDRIPAARWQIEWYLPWWVGESFRLDEARAQQFVLSNVLGLAAIRLQDDLADGDAALGQSKAASGLARKLFESALEIYRPYFPSDSPFWARVDALLRAWRTATASVNHLHLHDLRVLSTPETATTQQIANLGAPLKISAHAICELTGRNLICALDPLLDHALLATVLYDHAVDCDADLRAGRWNLFVAVCSDHAQTRSFERENRARLIHAFMSSETPRVYFQYIAHHLAEAQRLNRDVGITALDSYLDEFCLEIWQTHDTLVQYYQHHLEQVTRKLFGALYPITRPSKGEASLDSRQRAST